jgi:hypothetical protein
MNVTLTRNEGIRPPGPPWGAFAVLIFLFGIGPVAGDVNFPDDHGDTAATATPLALPATVNAEIEIDTDKDFFSFSLEKGKQYAMTVSRDGIRDIDVALLGLNGQGVLARFDSVVKPNASFTWANLFGDITVFLRVGGFAEFTTGGYTLHVAAGVDIVDSDNDGLPDVWELHFFGNLDQGPGDDPDGDDWTNLEELYLGTDPTQADAGLRIRTVDLLPGGAQRLGWPAAPLRVYRVDRSPTMTPPSWSPVGTVTGTTSTATMLDATAGTATQRYYRVELQID